MCNGIVKQSNNQIKWNYSYKIRRGLQEINRTCVQRFDVLHFLRGYSWNLCVLLFCEWTRPEKQEKIEIRTNIWIVPIKSYKKNLSENKTVPFHPQNYQFKWVVINRNILIKWTRGDGTTLEIQDSEREEKKKRVHIQYTPI